MEAHGTHNANFGNYLETSERWVSEIVISKDTEGDGKA